MEEDEYIKYFIRAFEQFKPSWYKAKPPSVQKIRECNIKFDDKNQAYLTNFSNTNREYKRKTGIDDYYYLINRGVLRHKKLLSLTEWYLNNVENQVQEAIYSRFSHFLMDETQDTSVYQFELIEKVIDNSKIIFQKFGDPYQALYNLYNNEEDQHGYLQMKILWKYQRAIGLGKR